MRRIRGTTTYEGEIISSSLEQSTFGPNARGDARDRWRYKVDLVLVRFQLAEIDLASRCYDLRIEVIPLLSLRVEPNDDLRLGFDIQRRLPFEVHIQENRFETATTVSELAAESDLDWGFLADNA